MQRVITFPSRADRAGRGKSRRGRIGLFGFIRRDLLLALCLALAAASCGREAPSKGQPQLVATAPSVATDFRTPAALQEALSISRVEPGDPTRGKALALEYQCNRCHDGSGHEPMQLSMHCVHCHQQILAGEFKAPRASLDKWVKTVQYVQVAPSLEAISERLRGDWIADYLQQPHDVRPELLPNMPRLAIDAETARHLVAYLTEGKTARVPAELGRHDRALGRKLLETRGCGSCHTLSGAPPLPQRPRLEPGDHAANRAIMLAPDLYHTRQRFRPDRLVAWLEDPASLKPSTLMPATGLSRSEAEQVAAYLLYEPFAKPPAKPMPKRLPLLERRVSYTEVDEKVFRVTCRHCHSNQDIALGEGGPGNTGGFGFEAKGLDLSSYRAISSGYKDAEGVRHSVFAPLSDGTPRLVAALLARQAEERGQPNREVRGMPLGLPALSPVQIQLLESWVAQGRPR